MSKIYIDDIISIKEYDVKENEDIFEKILNIRKEDEEIDFNRFFLKFVDKDKLREYDFSNPSSAQEFRSINNSFDPIIKKMGGYNGDPEVLKSGSRFAGANISDPEGYIYGQFNYKNGILTYSPIFPHFYEQRDLIKFANDDYFTTMTFEEIMFSLIGKTSKFLVHTGDYSSIKDIRENGRYIHEEITKEQMIKYVEEPYEGEKIFRKYLKI